MPMTLLRTHECSLRAGKYVEHTWGNVEFQTYRACMPSTASRNDTSAMTKHKKKRRTS
jgi:hypothetical protein